MNNNWWDRAVIYQIYPRSFNDSNGDGLGDLAGITAKLPYIKELGADALWLCPIYRSPMDDNGYDISDYRRINPEMGSMADFEALAARCRELGLRLILDMVFNHTSDEHPWFREARSTADNPYRDYYIWRDGRSGGTEPNNWPSCFEESAWTKDELSGQYYLHLFSRKQPDLNWENPKVREEIFAILRFWQEKGVDGFRLDVINFISKVPGLPDNPGEGRYVPGGEGFRNGPRIHEYLRMIREVVSEGGRECLLIGEMPGIDVEQGRLYTGADRGELDMVFQFEHMELDGGEESKFQHRFRGLRPLKDSLCRWQEGLGETGWNSLYLSNHDQPRPASRFCADERFGDACAKMLCTMLHMMKGTPFVYQGEELGMRNTRFASLGEYRDVETLNYYAIQRKRGLSEEEILRRLSHKSRDHARTPLLWDESAQGGFSAGEPWIKVQEEPRRPSAEIQLKTEDSVFRFYRKAIALRRELPVIAYGDFRCLDPGREESFCYRRTLGGQSLTVLLNLSPAPLDLPPEAALSEGAVLILGNYGAGGEERRLRPYESRAYLSGEARPSS